MGLGKERKQGGSSGSYSPGGGEAKGLPKGCRGGFIDDRGRSEPLEGRRGAHGPAGGVGELGEDATGQGSGGSPESRE